MLRQVAEGVLFHQSELLLNNTAVVQGKAGVLLVDAGITGHEMGCLANDLSDLGQPVVAGFSTHPDWDHVLWHAELGEAPRYDGPEARIIRHPAHSQGHAALLIEERRILVAGDMLSDLFVPMLDFAAADPLEDVADDVDAFVPGHGSEGGADQLRARIDLDRAYVHALRDGGAFDDPRIDSPKPGWEWVSDIHTGQLEQLAQKRERDRTPG